MEVSLEARHTTASRLCWSHEGVEAVLIPYARRGEKKKIFYVRDFREGYRSGPNGPSHHKAKVVGGVGTMTIDHTRAS